MLICIILALTGCHHWLPDTSKHAHTWTSGGCEGEKFENLTRQDEESPLWKTRNSRASFFIGSKQGLWFICWSVRTSAYLTYASLYALWQCIIRHATAMRHYTLYALWQCIVRHIFCFCIKHKQECMVQNPRPVCQPKFFLLKIMQTIDELWKHLFEQICMSFHESGNFNYHHHHYHNVYHYHYHYCHHLYILSRSTPLQNLEVLAWKLAELWSFCSFSSP